MLYGSVFVYNSRFIINNKMVALKQIQGYILMLLLDKNIDQEWNIIL